MDESPRATKRKLKLNGKGVEPVRAHNALNINGLRYKLQSMRDNDINKIASTMSHILATHPRSFINRSGAPLTLT